MTGKLVVLAGPSGVGKGTIAKYILENFPGFRISVSATTRNPRPDEVHGQHYFFVSKQDFEAKIDSGEMLEWARVHGQHYYGTPKTPVLEAISKGDRVILEIDIQGARQVKAAHPDAITIFIAPPSFDELVARLEGRGTESASEKAKRLQTARIELDSAGEFDFVVINNEVARCAQEVVELLETN
jgi:guanylate kinase